MNQRVSTLQVGNHAIVVYSNKEEKFNEALEFLKIGLDRDEVIMLITEDISKSEILNKMSEEWGIDAQYLAKKGDIIIKTNKEWYFPDGKPNTQRTIALWIALVDQCLSKGKRGLRVVGDTNPFFSGGYSKELIEYESSLEQKFGFPITAICAYEKRFVDSLTLQQMDVLRDHHSHVWLGSSGNDDNDNDAHKM